MAADLGAVLEAVARSAADQQHIGQRGWKSIRKSPFELFSYWQTSAPVSGAPRSAGKRRSRKAMISSSAASVGAAVLGVGIDLDAMRVVGELDPAPFEVGEAVEDVAAVEIGPAGHRGRQEAAVAGRRGEIEYLLAGRRGCAGRSRRGTAWAATGPSANTNAVGLDPFARSPVADLVELCRRRARRCDGALHDTSPPARTKWSTSVCTDAPRHQRPEAGFVQADFDPGEVDHREAPLPSRRGPAPRSGARARDGRRCCRGHNRRRSWKKNSTPRLMKIGRPDDRAQRLPLRQAVQRHAGVDRVLAVAGAGQPRLRRPTRRGCAPGRRRRSGSPDGPLAAGDARSTRRTRRRRSPPHVRRVGSVPTSISPHRPGTSHRYNAFPMRSSGTCTPSIGSESTASTGT